MTRNSFYHKEPIRASKKSGSLVQGKTGRPVNLLPPGLSGVKAQKFVPKTDILYIVLKYGGEKGSTGVIDVRMACRGSCCLVKQAGKKYSQTTTSTP